MFWDKLAPSAKKGIIEYATAEYFDMRCKWPDSYRTRLIRISFGLKNGNPTVSAEIGTFQILLLLNSFKLNRRKR